MRTSSEIVDYLVRHYQGKNQNVNNLLSPFINDLIAQLGEYLETRLENNSPHKAVWDDFTKEPMDNAASLSGILEAIFEAQPAVRDRVNGFMRKVTALEKDETEGKIISSGIESSLKSEAGAIVSDDSSGILAETKEEKNPSLYLYGNEQAGFESERRLPVSNPFMIGKNAQIVYVPTGEVEFPAMFDHLINLSDNSKKLTQEKKQDIQVKLYTIRSLLVGDSSFEDQELTNLIESLWEIAPEYANALIKALQKNIDALPIDAQRIIILMDHKQ
jgi:hypothetical protein